MKLELLLENKILMFAIAEKIVNRIGNSKPFTLQHRRDCEL